MKLQERKTTLGEGNNNRRDNKTTWSAIPAGSTNFSRDKGLLAKLPLFVRFAFFFFRRELAEGLIDLLDLFCTTVLVNVTYVLQVGQM